MKVIKIELSNAEHDLLEEYAKKNSKSIKEVVREAIRETIEGKVNPNDPIFTCPPSSKSTGKRSRNSVEHDRYLYGENAIDFS